MLYALGCDFFVYLAYRDADEDIGGIAGRPGDPPIAEPGPSSTYIYTNGKTNCI